MASLLVVDRGTVMNWTEVVWSGIGGAVGGAIASLVVRLITGRGDAKSQSATAIAMIPGALLGAAVAGSQHFQDFLHPPSRLELYIRQHKDDLFSSPAVREKFKGLSRAAAREEGARLSHLGLKRLPSQDLVRWNELKLAMADRSESVCAGFWTGKIDQEQVSQVLNELPQQEMEDWMGLSSKAASLEAEGKPAPSLPADAATRGFMQVRNGLQEPQRTRFQTAAAAGIKLADPEACWTMKTLMKAIPEMPDAARDEFLRALASI